MTMKILTPKEKLAQEAFLKSIKVHKRKTKKPLVVAVVGLVGSGKSSVARELARLIGATVIEGDAIRLELRNQKERYDNVKKIAENVAIEILKREDNVIIDGDMADSKKRASLREKAKVFGARMIFIRTYADRDVMFERIISSKYTKDSFFGGASSTCDSDNTQIRGVVIKTREMWRRTPHHYRWENKEGGRWILKKSPFAVFAEIDTSDTKKWKNEVRKISRKLENF